ncbi:MAG: histone deacetylase [Sandaracinaceae bacterium]
MEAIRERALTVLVDESFNRHHAPEPHPERPERLAAARSGLALAQDPSCWRTLEAEAASAEALRQLHDPGYVTRLEEVLQEGRFGYVDGDTFFSPGTYEAAWRAAGGALRLGRALAEGHAERAVALVRPPGHHAEADRPMGFCFLNHVALAAQAALNAGARRVAIVDWDVHHGNGTQHLFDEDPRVLFASVHEWPLFPGTGRPTEVGRGPGLGTTINVALPAGSGDEEYAHAFRQAVLPSVRDHEPDVILVSAGYDAHARDPLARQEASSLLFGALTSALVAIAEDQGHGRVGAVLEGGYDLRALEDSVRATGEALLGARVDLPEDRPAGAALAAVAQTVAAHRRHGLWAREDRLF